MKTVLREGLAKMDESYNNNELLHLLQQRLYTLNINDLEIN